MKAQAIFGIILLLILVVAVIGFIHYLDKECEIDGDCPVIECIRAPCDVNKCIDNKCQIEPLIGGCAGVSLEYRQECCNNWAHENNIAIPTCVGEWEIKDNECAWTCGESGVPICGNNLCEGNEGRILCVEPALDCVGDECKSGCNEVCPEDCD